MPNWMYPVVLDPNRPWIHRTLNIYFSPMSQLSLFSPLPNVKVTLMEINIFCICGFISLIM